VIAELGRIGSPTLAVIGDDTGGLPIKLIETNPLDRGSLLDVRGVLAAPYGQLELRVARDGLAVVGSGTPPPAVPVTRLDEATEGRLVWLEGELDGKPRRTGGGDVSITIITADGTEIRAGADGSAAVDPGSFTPGRRYRLTGIAGQRATHKGALDGYRLWLRDRADVISTGGSTPSSSPSPSPLSRPTSSGVMSIARAKVLHQGAVTVEGVITAGPTLLDASDRRIVIEDASGGIEILLPDADRSISPGRRLRVAGAVGRAYGAPRIKAATVKTIGTGIARPRAIGRAPGTTDEWRLVRIAGRVTDVKKLGDRWRAEIAVGAATLVVIGLPGARIPSDRLGEGRRATIVGIVRRPYPTATDRRFAILPRGPGDITLQDAGDPGTPGGTSGAGPTASGGRGLAVASTSPVDVDLIDLDASIGMTVRAGGLVSDLAPDGFLLDDGTASRRVILEGSARELASLVEPGDAVNVIGRPTRVEDEIAIVVTDASGLVRAGDAQPSEAPLPSSTAGVLPGGTPAVGSPGRLHAFGDLPDVGGPAGLVTILLATLASVGVTLLRRARARRLVTARIRRRLAAVSAPASTQR
jgi:hypothetical protein